MLRPVEGLFTLTNTRSGYNDKIRADERKRERFEDKLQVMDSFFFSFGFYGQESKDSTRWSTPVPQRALIYEQLYHFNNQHNLISISISNNLAGKSDVCTAEMWNS